MTSVKQKAGKSISKCFCTSLGRLLGLLGGRWPKMAKKSSSISFFESYKEKFFTLSISSIFNTFALLFLRFHGPTALATSSSFLKIAYFTSLFSFCRTTSSEFDAKERPLRRRCTVFPSSRMTARRRNCEEGCSK